MSNSHDSNNSKTSYYDVQCDCMKKLDRDSQTAKWFWEKHCLLVLDSPKQCVCPLCTPSRYTDKLQKEAPAVLAYCQGAAGVLGHIGLRIRCAFVGTVPGPRCLSWLQKGVSLCVSKDEKAVQAQFTGVWSAGATVHPQEDTLSSCLKPYRAENGTVKGGEGDRLRGRSRKSSQNILRELDGGMQVWRSTEPVLSPVRTTALQHSSIW